MSKNLLEKMGAVFGEDTAMAAGVATRSGVVAGQTVPDPTAVPDPMMEPAIEPAAEAVCPLQQPKAIVLF
jgi:hypothetical protein